MAAGVSSIDLLLSDQPGWTAGPAGSWQSEIGTFLARTYEKGRVRAVVEVTAGPMAAEVVAQAMNFSLGESEGRIGSRTWLLRGRRAHLVTERGMVHTLGVILRGGAGDLPGSVRLEIKGRALRPEVAVELALALDWDAIVAALAGGASARPGTDCLRGGASFRRGIPGERTAPVAHAAVAPHDEADGQAPEPPAPPVRHRQPGADLGIPAHRGRAAPAARPRRPRPGGLGRDADAGARHAAAWVRPRLPLARLHLASARLRDALDLGPEVVEYREVDMSGSVAEARAADYRVFRAVQEADPVDLRRMYGHEPDRALDGSPTTAWLMSVSGPHAAPRRTVWREGFVPPAPLFLDRMGRLIATEALAERVTRAGLADVSFQDVTSEAALQGIALRPG